MSIRPIPGARRALELFALAFLAYLAVAGALLPLGAAGFAASEILVLAAAPILYVRVRGHSVRRTFGLWRPRAAAVAGALLIGASFWVLNLMVAAPVSEALGGERELEALEELMFGEGLSLPVYLLLIGAVPAVCEELLLRGLVLRALHPVLGGIGTVVATAVLFSLMHLSLPRLAPTFALGLVLGYAAVATGSIAIPILIHFINNFIGIALTLGAITGVETAIEQSPIGVGLGAAALTIVGLVLVSLGRSEGSSSGIENPQ